MYATMSGWWTVSTVAKSRALNASSPFFMSASRRAVRLVSVVVGMMTSFLVGDTSVHGRDDRDLLWCMGVLAAIACGDQRPARALLAPRACGQPRSPLPAVAKGSRSHFLRVRSYFSVSYNIWLGVYSSLALRDVGLGTSHVSFSAVPFVVWLQAPHPDR